MKKFKVGIAGYGIVGKRRRHYIDKNPWLETVALSDILFNENGIFKDGVRYYKNYKDLVKSNIDILFVCLPNRFAPEASILALKNNMHVFCEKPPGRSVSDIKKVIQIEKKKPSLKLKYGFNHRYHDSVQEAKKIIERKKYGDIINFRGVYGKSLLIPFTGEWRSKRFNQQTLVY